MTKTEKRIKFMKLIGKLLCYADEQGIDVICYSFHRTQKQQDLLYEWGKSKVRRSKHQDWLAMDLAVVKGGEVVWERIPEYDKLGEYWESLDPECVWGGRWKSLEDIYHFELA